MQLVVHNERTSTVTAYVQWVGFQPTRLGVIGAGSSAAYLPAYRAGALCVWTTSFGNTASSTALPDRDPDLQCPTGIPVDRGQRMDVFLRQGGPTCYLQYDPEC